MFKYKISIDKKIISILGPHLYGDTASIIAELVSNSHDADADNCWVTIKTGAKPEIIIEDDGIGMTPKEVNKYFLDIGYDRRIERAVTAKGRSVFGRKGIGKLAAFSLAKKIELYSLKDGKKAGCILDYDKITLERKDPKTIPDEEIKFSTDKLSPTQTGTRLVLKDIQKNINTTYYYLVNRLMRNFNIPLDTFKVHIAKNSEAPSTVNYSDLNFFDQMDTIITIGNEFKERGDRVRNNPILEKYKRVFCYEDDFKDGKKAPIQIPKRITILGKDGKKKEIDFTFKGWMGTIVNRDHFKGLVKKEGATQEEEKSISINDNRITVFSRKRIGEYDVLPKVQTTQVNDAYLIGEIQADTFEDDTLVDMAISNRRGYEETDERYRALIEELKSLASFIVQRKNEVMRVRHGDKEKEESDNLKKAFESKTKTMEILKQRLDQGERDTVADENLQFMRAAKLGQSTRKIFISHDSENQQYGFFIMKIFSLLGVDIDNMFIFTSYPPTGVPFGENIYEYLKNCFRDDIYVIFLFSRHFYDSNVCIAETGAAWATNRNHANIIIDIGFQDVDKPIDNAKCSLAIRNLDEIDRAQALKFIKTVYTHCGWSVPPDNKILLEIEKAVTEFRGKLNTDSFYPKRRYQGHPVCEDPQCGNTMRLKKVGADLHYECKTPKCGKKTTARVERD